jgi:hypothetical protein
MACIVHIRKRSDELANPDLRGNWGADLRIAKSVEEDMAPCSQRRIVGTLAQQIETKYEAEF